MISLIHGIPKTKQMNKHNKRKKGKQTHRYREQMGGCQMGGGGGMVK